MSKSVLPVRTFAPDIISLFLLGTLQDMKHLSFSLKCLCIDKAMLSAIQMELLTLCIVGCVEVVKKSYAHVSEGQASRWGIQ